MKHYLSIDADYWTNAAKAEQALLAVVNRAANRKVPIVAVMNHQQLLPFVNASSARKLINVDEHSDLASCDIERLECGSWVSYVRWRRNGEYLWIRNCKALHVGNCNGNGLTWKAGNDWGKTSSRYQPLLPIASLVDRNCVGVGLCMSPDYANPFVQDAFMRVVRSNAIQWRKGRRNENYGRNGVSPPFRDPQLLQQAIRLRNGPQIGV